MANKQSEIRIAIDLDSNHIPEAIHWTAADGGVENAEAKAMMVNFWDADKKELLRMDLWTKEMSVDDMKRFYHQMLISMAQSYQRATQEEDVAQEIEGFAKEFALKSGLIS